MAELETNGPNGPEAQETTPDTTSTSEISPQITESTPKQVMEANANPTPQEIADWMKDGRYGKVWKNPNDLYKSYRNIEKMYEPLKKQYDTYDSTFKKLGVDPNSLEEIMTEYNSFKDPNNPMIQKSSYLDKWLNNPLYNAELESFFNDLEVRELQRLYPGMNAQQIQEHMELKEQNKKFEEYIQNQEIEKAKNVYSQEIDNGLNKIKKVSESKGFQYTQEIENKLLDYCMKNQIPSKFMYHTFLDLYGDELDKNFSKLQEKRVLEKLNNNQKKGVILGAANINTNNSINNKSSLKDDLKKLFNK